MAKGTNYDEKLSLLEPYYCYFLGGPRTKRGGLLSCCWLWSFPLTGVVVTLAVRNLGVISE